MTDPGDLTLAAYAAGVQGYLEHSAAPGPAMQTYLDQLAAVVGAGHVLELGSGPGWDAAHLESRGVRVTRTDATRAFVEMLRAAGHDARLLDVRTDALGGAYEAVLADAVLLIAYRTPHRTGGAGIFCASDEQPSARATPATPSR